MVAVAGRPSASIERTVARWESQRNPTLPGERYQFLLAAVYARTPAGGLELGPGSDFVTYLEVLRQAGTAEGRLRELRNLVEGGSARDTTDLLAAVVPGVQARVLAVLRAPERLDDELCQELSDSTAAINQSIGTVPFGRLHVRLAPLLEVGRQLAEAELPDAVQGQAVAFAAQTYALGARLAFETRDDEMAVHLYRRAAETAAQHLDRRLRAEIATSHTMVTLHATGDVEAARGIARGAVRDAHAASSYAVRARAHAVHAELCARGGQPEAANNALERAWRSVEQLHVDEPANSFNEDRLNGFDGLCALHAGNAEHAHNRLSTSVATLTGPRDAVQRGIVLADLALARLKLGEPDACAELLAESVDLAARTQGRVAAQRIRQTRAALQPWRTEDFVGVLDEHIHEQLLG